MHNLTQIKKLISGGTEIQPVCLQSWALNTAFPMSKSLRETEESKEEEDTSNQVVA